MFFTTQFHVNEQRIVKPILRRRGRQDESVSKKVIDIDRRFIDASLRLCASNPNLTRAEPGPSCLRKADGARMPSELEVDHAGRPGCLS